LKRAMKRLQVRQCGPAAWRTRPAAGVMRSARISSNAL
jgi:hypothetical protein